MKEEVIINLISGLAELFRRDMTAAIHHVYCEALLPLPAQHVKTAVKKWALAETKMPLPVEISKLAWGIKVEYDRRHKKQVPQREPTPEELQKEYINWRAFCKEVAAEGGNEYEWLRQGIKRTENRSVRKPPGQEGRDDNA